jgi:hypothetical protein
LGPLLWISIFGNPVLAPYVDLTMKNLMRKVKVYFPRVYSGNLQENQALHKSVNMDANSLQTQKVTGLRHAIAVILQLRETLLAMLRAQPHALPPFV